jgi:uncharacterized cupredoxin-like copper-binding protein
VIRNKLPATLLVLALVGLAACSTSNGAGSQPAASAAQQVTIKGSEFKFDPSAVTWKANQPVTLVFQNVGTVDHDVDLTAMPAANVKVDLSGAGNIPASASSTAQQNAQAGKVYLYAAPGKQATATFTPTTAGAYQFFCSLPGHKEAGMIGTATVQ